MRLASRIIMVFLFLPAWAAPAAAGNWLSGESFRVRTLGGITLSVEDETTEITPLNHGNPAGLALVKPLNRLDLGASNFRLTRNAPAGDGIPAKAHSLALLEATRPNGEFRGLTYWPDDRLVIRAELEGFALSLADSTGSGPVETLNLYGLAGGAGAAYQTDFGLALGAGLRYGGAGGKPESPTGRYAVAGPGTTLFKISASNWNWAAGAAYVIDPVCGDSRLSLGFHAGSGGERPDFSRLNPADPAASAFNDYTLSFTLENTLPPPSGGVFTVYRKQTFANNPFYYAGEAILNIGDILAAGLLLDGKSRTTWFREETRDSAGSFSRVEYRFGEWSSLVFTPVARVKVPLREDCHLIAGILASNCGSGTLDRYAPPAGETEAHRVFSQRLCGREFVGGLGVQALGRQLQAGAQYRTDETEKNVAEINAVDGPLSAGRSRTFSAGAEYWLLPIFCLRAGYALTVNTLSPPAVYADGAPVRDAENRPAGLVQTLSRFDAGAGLDLPNGLKVDLLLELTAVRDDPPQYPESSQTGTGIFLGGRIPM